LPRLIAVAKTLSEAAGSPVQKHHDARDDGRTKAALKFGA
jgi:hypothetical protein